MRELSSALCFFPPPEAGPPVSSAALLSLLTGHRTSLAGVAMNIHSLGFLTARNHSIIFLLQDSLICGMDT